MPRQAINPASMYESVPFGFSHAVKRSGRTTIHCAGQTAWDKDRNIVGLNDLAAQTAQVLENLKTVLAEAGATPADVVRMRTYVVNHSPDKLEVICSAISKFYGDVPPAPNTLIGVQALALPEFLIEIEATAVID
ncbi:MAG TPA: Rid family hydrolase [Sphingomonadales bacterium]|jgi:enamine deaminase RidA (YjgF/YER057c/UK114 family)